MLEWLPGTLAKKIIGDGASSLLSRAARWFASRKFKRVFGDGVCVSAYSLVYAELALAHQSNPYPYMKPEGLTGGCFSISRPVSGSEVRCVSYLASAIGNNVGSTPTVRSDLETRHLLDLDFISFGGPNSNLKTADCQSNDGNRLARLDQNQNTFVNLVTQQRLLEFEPGFDYGLILKIRPIQFPKRVWMACAGIGEWGTSGAAWFLANKWREIKSRAEHRSFAIVVRVRPGQDQSAQISVCLLDVD